MLKRKQNVYHGLADSEQFPQNFNILTFDLWMNELLKEGTTSKL